MTEASATYNVPRGTAVLTTQQAIIYPISFLFYLFIARILTKSEIGQISLLSAALAIFTTVTQLALPVAATQFISNSLGRQDALTAGAVARTALRLTVIIAVSGLIVAGLISSWIGNLVLGVPAATSLLIMTFLAGFVLDFVALYGGFFLGLGLYARRAYQFLLYVPLSRGLGLLLAYLGWGVLGVVLGWALGALVALGMSLFFSHGLLRSTRSYHPRPMLAFGLPLFAAALITFGQAWGDIALLQALRGQLATTGAYFLVVSSVGGIGLSTIGPLSILWTPVAAALYPALASSHAKHGTEAVSGKLAVAFRLTNLVVLPTGVALAAVASTALELAYGPGYAIEAMPFAILTLTAVFASQATLLSTTLQALGKTKQLLTVTLVATIIDLAVVWLTARTLGSVGGALGRALLALATVLLARHALGPTISGLAYRGLLKSILLACSIGIPLAIGDQLLIRVVQMSAILRLPILLAVFSFSSLVVGRSLSIFRPDDFSLVKKALPQFLHRPLRIIQHLLTA